MTSTDANLASGTRGCTVACQAEHQALSGGTSSIDDLIDMLRPGGCSNADMLDFDNMDFTAESRPTTPPAPNGLVPQPHSRTTPASNTVAPAPVAVPLAVPQQAQPNMHPALQPAPGLVFTGQMGYMQLPLQHWQLSSSYPQLGQLMPAHQHPRQQLQAAPPPYMYPQQLPQPPPQHQWQPQPPLQELQLLPQLVLPAAQQHQIQEQQQPQAAVSPPDGAPSEEWLQETADLLSSTEGDLHNIGLQRLGDMMLGLGTHLDAKGYKLPTAFPEPPGDVLRPPGPASYLLVTRGRAKHSRQNSGAELPCVISLT